MQQFLHVCHVTLPRAMEVHSIRYMHSRCPSNIHQIFSFSLLWWHRVKVATHNIDQYMLY
jgi:hypothetical protein